jgi:WD40 repeat protein
VPVPRVPADVPTGSCGRRTGRWPAARSSASAGACWPRAACWSPATATAARTGGTGAGRAVHRWDAATGTPLGTVSDPGGAGVRSLAINVMGTQLAVAGKNGTTYVWNLPS